MVAQSIITTSNSRLPTSLVAVFVGATSGIGEYTLKSFARQCKEPRAYFIGRSQSAADRILSSLKTINPAGTYTFLKSDIAELKNVDLVCSQIIAKEPFVNMLVLSQGTMTSGIDTSEGLHLPSSLIIHSRVRFILNLLPLLKAAPELRRVVSIFTGTKEGPITSADLQMRHLKSMSDFLKARGQAASCVTLCMQRIASDNPDVGFVHDYPGAVQTNFARGPGIAAFAMRLSSKLLGPFLFVKSEVSGDRHLYLATSARYQSKTGEAVGVGMDGGVEPARGIDGKSVSGMYVVDENCESASTAVEDIVRKVKEEGKDKMVWETVTGDFVRITGKESI